MYFPKGLNLKEHNFIRKPKQNFLKIEVYLNQSEGVCVLRRALWPPLREAFRKKNSGYNEFGTISL